MKKSLLLRTIGRSIILLIAILPLLIIGSCQKEELTTISAVTESQTDSPKLKSASTSDYLLELIQTIKSMVDDGLINKGIGNSLISKIENAIKSLNKSNTDISVNKLSNAQNGGKTNSEIGQLNAVIKEIEGLMANGLISSEQGQLLILQTEIALNKIEGLTYIPDDNFEQALIDLGYDEAPLDDYVTTSNIASITELTLYRRNVSDLRGIEDFVALLGLDCSRNQLTSLDISNNINLIALGCEYNQLTSLDVSRNIGLTFLGCLNNQLTSLDISNNTNLVTFTCSQNPFLFCVQVDNAEEIPFNYLKDDWTLFSEDCGY